MGLRKKLAYAAKVLPGATWRSLGASPSEPAHLIIMMADHFEPAIDPQDGLKRVPRSEQERRLEWWSREYPEAADRWRDDDGRPFVHTYFYPAEQYDEGLLQILAEHCRAGWGELEIHLHHGIFEPDTAENTERVLSEFRDHLAFRHGCLAVEEGDNQPRYGFVHGNFALANSAEGKFCGVDSEMQVLADTGCYADFTLPAGLFHAAQIRRMNSIYECGGRLDQRAPHRSGTNLRVGRAPQKFPLMIQGPLIANWKAALRDPRRLVETSAVTRHNPMSIRRLELWKRARIGIDGRPDWLFIKLHCHSMDPTQKDAVVGNAFRVFLQELVSGASDRKEILHFVTGREMTNIVLAACDGREGNPGDYRDYRFKKISSLQMQSEKLRTAPVSVKG